ncbi:MAG: TetR/AcrR family transcriptional regulator [Planctomycetaceae bacterium]|nr:TetR/AcrR family transcriptional regulator [Planctomycetaceae bacterium]
MRRDTKELICNTAIAAIARDGTLSVNTVIKDSGLSRSLFFYHFPTKQDLLFRLADRDFERRINRIKTCAKAIPDKPGRMLKAYVMAWVDGFRLTGQEQLNTMSGLHEPLIREHLAKQIEHMFDMLWDPDVPEITTRIVVNACIGGSARNLVGDRTREEIITERKAIAEELLDIIDHVVQRAQRSNR